MWSSTRIENGFLRGHNSPGRDMKLVDRMELPLSPFSTLFRKFSYSLALAKSFLNLGERICPIYMIHVHCVTHDF